MNTISFKTTKEETAAIGKLARLASEMGKEFGIQYSVMDANMDLTACHANGNLLDLDRMVGEIIADGGRNLGHDFFGIRRHINRQTGQLEGCFVPRFSISNSILPV